MRPVKLSFGERSFTLEPSYWCGRDRREGRGSRAGGVLPRRLTAERTFRTPRCRGDMFDVGFKVVSGLVLNPVMSLGETGETGTGTMSSMDMN